MIKKGGKFMKFIFLGKYSKAGLTGFINNPSQDRKSIISSMMEKAGGTLDELFLTRGAYDVVVIGSANEKLHSELISLINEEN